jgi:2-polyprenyl-3-methyl-5-hydroxy-6-metoxy-1,4-benzoquinol methylase/spore coat polysaccharide biosynthesis predicted glycosyltransferase SpsG/predicted RNA-binding Zn-ribbon protein involved in translation (DUF1610 family)
MNPTWILIVPCCEEGRGGGHLNRCISLTNELRYAGREAYFFLQEKTEQITNLLESRNFNMSWVLNKNQVNRPFALIVLDRNQTPHSELLHWKKLAPVIGIDEGGRHRDNFDFLIDILIPKGFEHPSANITSIGLLELPKKIKNKTDTKNEKLKILISFGQEDAAGLGLKTINKLAESNIKDAEITLLKGGLNKSETPIPDYVKTLESIPNLADHLYEYDIVITHYGITAYEASYAGVNVFLDHPTSYHKKIAKAAGFSDISALTDAESVEASSSVPIDWSEIKQEKIANLINSFTPQINKNCPVCGKASNKHSSARFHDRTYRRCSKCGAIYMDRANPAPIEYDKEYFFESYKKQYGKTYLEDFPNLIAMAKRRLKVISRILHTKNTKEQRSQSGGSGYYPPIVLDIGCAYGAFLSAAKEEGFLPFGIDPAQDAVSYVQETLSIPAVQGFFPNYPLVTNSSQLYDAVTMWYVIEHFTDCVPVLAEIKKLLKPGGILAFSTPSFSGASGRKSLRGFLENSPPDHFTIWSPKMCKRALSLAGFKVKKIVMTGCHPERFPYLGKYAQDKESRLYKILMIAGKILHLGDTFEVYAKT